MSDCAESYNGRRQAAQRQSNRCLPIAWIGSSWARYLGVDGFLQRLRFKVITRDLPYAPSLESELMKAFLNSQSTFDLSQFVESSAQCEFVLASPELTGLIVSHCSFSPWPPLKDLFGNVSDISALEVDHPPNTAFVQFVKFISTLKTGPLRRPAFCGSDFDALFMVQLAILIETSTVNSLAFLNRITHDRIRVISEMAGDKLKILISFPLPSRTDTRWPSNFFSPRKSGPLRGTWLFNL
jgi:hypothetical protein